jgi:hypothetical protein
LRIFNFAILFAVLVSFPAYAQDNLLFLSAVAKCLNSRLDDIPPVSDPESVPPGLIPGHNVSVTMLHGDTGKAFSYRGTVPNVISCGVALYGPVPDYVRKSARGAIERSGRWKVSSPDFWKLSVPPADNEYWGDLRAPGLSGVTILTRQPGPDAPTLEIEFHRVLVR